MPRGWGRCDPAGIPPAALEGAFERLVAELRGLLAPVSDDERALDLAAIGLASRTVAAAKVRLWLGAARTDDDTPATAARELESMVKALRRALQAKRTLSLRATTIASIVGRARGVVALDWDHLERVLRIYEEAADAGLQMKAVGPDFLLDRLAEVYLVLTGKQPPISASERGPYYRVARTMLAEAGMEASIVDHARRWVDSRSPNFRTTTHET